MGVIKLIQCSRVAVSAHFHIYRRIFHKKCYFSQNLKFFLPFSTIINLKMKTAYFQQEVEKVHINLNYNEDVKSILNFDRPIVENMETFLQKVQSKLQSLALKKSKKKNKNVSLESLPEMNVSLLLNNEIVSGETKFVDLFEKGINGDFKLKINDAEYDVFFNMPMIRSMTLPKLILTGTIVFPETLEIQYMDINDSDYVWYKSRTPQKLISWEQCGEGFFYAVKEEDVGNYLKVVCTPKMDEKVGPVFEIVSSSGVIESRAFEEIHKRHEFTKEPTKFDEIRIVSYNILADMYTKTKDAKTEIFTFCDPAFLHFSYRKILCVTELLGYNADIICLQEVGCSYNSILQLLFSKKNYTCLYHEKEGTREGCSLIFKNGKFNIVSVSQHIFSKELLNEPLMEDIKVKLQGNENLMTRIEKIPSQMQQVVLETSLNNILIVGNMHLYFHPDADHIRLLQGILSWRILQNTYEEMKKKFPDKKISILLCGDFNSTPECGFHEFLRSGSVGSEHIDWKSKEDEEIKDLSFKHSLKIMSAYDNTQCTNYTPLFKGCLDYIYFQVDHLKLKQTVPIPSEEVLSRYSGIPSEFFPSDHVALVADLKFDY